MPGTAKIQFRFRKHIQLIQNGVTEINSLTEEKKYRIFLLTNGKNELDYKLKKQLWTFNGNRIAVRFEYEYRDKNNQWYRAYGNEHWEFDENGLMKKRFASINDLKIKETERTL